MAVPVNSAVPTISGTVAVGETLTSSTGTWSPTPTSYAYQWQRVNATTVDISGATQSTYVVTALDVGHYLRCEVIATNNSGDSLPAYTVNTILVPVDWFIVEDGTAKSDALSFVSVADADEYHARRNHTEWTLLTLGQKHAYLVDATEYIEEVYRERWKGLRKTATQALSWPREWVVREDYYAVDSVIPDSVNGAFYYPSNIVPTEVKNACAELAYKRISGELSPDIDRVTKREKLGPMEVEYQDYGKPYKVYRAIDNMLSVLLNSTSSGVFRKLERV